MSELGDYRCPKCGSKTTYVLERHGLCEKCYIESKRSSLDKLNLNDVQIKKCNICGRLFFGTSWIKSTKYNLVKIIMSILKGKIKKNIFQTMLFKIEIISPNEFKLNIIDKATGLNIGNKVFNVTYKNQICPQCMMKYSGTFFECIIRIRGSKKHLPHIDEILHNIIRKHIDSVELIDIKKIKSGEWDLFFGNIQDCSSIAKLLANLLKMEVSKYRSQRYFKGIKKSIIITEYVIK